MAAAKQKPDEPSVVIHLDADAIAKIRDRLAPEGEKATYISSAFSTFLDVLGDAFEDLKAASEACPNQKFTGTVGLEVTIKEDKDGLWIASPSVTGATLAGKTERPLVAKPSARATLADAQLVLCGMVEDAAADE